MVKILKSSEDYMKRYTRIVASINCHSLGYCTPSVAAGILKDAHEGRENWCEWIDACYKGNPKPAVQHAIMNRHTHEVYMADFGMAFALVKRYLETGDEPIFASWF